MGSLVFGCVLFRIAGKTKNFKKLHTLLQMTKLRNGLSGENIFLGGHSLGAAFLTSILDEFKNNVAGLVMLGRFVTQDTQDVVDSTKVPTLTLCGELDGLVCTSRIAESYHRAFTSKGDTDKAKLNNPVILIEGMNHFQYVNGEPPYIKKVRDLKSEIDDSDAEEAVGSTLAQFVDYHSQALRTDDPNVCTYGYIGCLNKLLHACIYSTFPNSLLYLQASQPRETEHMQRSFYCYFPKES
jgi:dienelactone hydrolase